MTPWRQKDPKQQGLGVYSLGDHGRPREQEQEQDQEQEQETTGDHGGQRGPTGANGNPSRPQHFYLIPFFPST